MVCFLIVHPRHSQILVLSFANSDDHFINQQLIFCASALSPAPVPFCSTKNSYILSAMIPAISFQASGRQDMGR